MSNARYICHAPCNAATCEKHELKDQIATLQAELSRCHEVVEAATAVVEYTHGNSDYARRQDFRNVRNELIDTLEKALAAHREKGG